MGVWRNACSTMLLVLAAIGCTARNPSPQALVSHSPAHAPPGPPAPRTRAPLRHTTLPPPDRVAAPPVTPTVANSPVSSAPAPASEVAEASSAPRSPALPNGLFNPMPGGFVGGYPADTGLDIAGFHQPVYALAAGTVVYSESGHTRWASDDRAVLLQLDVPIVIDDVPASEGGRGVITHVWYAHLSELRFQQARGTRPARRVGGGELLGVSGIANGSPHLHLGLLLDGVTDQRWGSFLRDGECREVLGSWRRGQRLPR